MRKMKMHKHNSKKATTLVELVVAMVLTAIFAVACISLIYPVSMIYTHNTELARAQLVADNVASCLRAACTGNNIEQKGDVWITSVGCDLEQAGENAVISTAPSGEVLVIRKSPEYCMTIASNYVIDGTLYSSVYAKDIKENDITYSPETGSNGIYSRAIYRMFNHTPGASEVASEEGRVHYGYFVANINKDGFVYPNEYYDFTDPLTKSAYDKYQIDLEFSELTYDADTNAPAYVNCLITVRDENGIAYARKIALRLS